MENFNVFALVYTGYLTARGKGICTITVKNKTTSANFDGINKGPGIFPNPSSNILFIKGLTENSRIAVYDIYRKKVLYQETNINQIDISNLSSGIFFLKIETKNGTITRKIVKQ